MITFHRQLSSNLKHLRCFTSARTFSSADEKGQEDEKAKEKNKVKTKISKEEANSKLNDLLKLMVKHDGEPAKEVKVTQAVKREKVKPVKEKPLGEKLADAAKDVATTLGGDVKKTESELLNILLKRSEAETHLLKDVLTGMKVDKQPTETNKAQQVRDTLKGMSASAQLRMESSKGKRKEFTRKTGAPVDILGAQPSSYFTGLQPAAAAPCQLSTWESCVDRDLRLASTHPPANIYEQMIQWTDRGMLWRFPIDNEQGLDAEKQVSFEEHIFLETHLEGWCPEKGPIRHFMELVCVGLSKNYWLSAEEKKNHIYWFRDYFADKQDLLKEIGAGAIAIEASETKEISQ